MTKTIEAYGKELEINWLNEQIAELCSRREKALRDMRKIDRVMYDFNEPEDKDVCSRHQVSC